MQENVLDRTTNRFFGVLSSILSTSVWRFRNTNCKVGGLYGGRCLYFQASCNMTESWAKLEEQLTFFCIVANSESLSRVGFRGEGAGAHLFKDYSKWVTFKSPKGHFGELHPPPLLVSESNPVLSFSSQQRVVQIRKKKNS